MICSNKYFLILLSLFAGIQLFAAPPVPFSGKLAINGKNFHGHALFSFSIVGGEGTVHWKHADEPDATIENFVMNGRYLVLLGGQGMQTLPADLFLKHESLFLRVSVDLKDGQGMRLLEPDQRITSSPYALSAEIARLAERAQVAGRVDAGAITADMLEQGLLADLNRTSELLGITREMLPQDVRDDLNREFTIEPGSIGKALLAKDVRDELNATITRERLSADVRADLNRTVGIANLSTEVTDKLNQTFSIDAGSITLDQLSQQVRDDINRTITRDRLSSDVLSDINRTITKSMLSQEVLDELNATIGPSKLSSEVSNALKPVVVGQPSSVVEHAGMPTYLAVDATGVDNTYQWKKNGVDILGATGRTLSISDLNASQHEGNYTVVVSNAFGSVTSSVTQIDVNGSLTEGLVGWWKFDETEGNIAYDSSGNNRDGNVTNVASWVDGRIHGALSLDGSTQIKILNYKGILGKSARTVTAWINSVKNNNAQGIAVWGSGNRYHIYIPAEGTKPGVLRLAVGGGYILGKTKVNILNEWIFLSIVTNENSGVADSVFYVNSSVEGLSESTNKAIDTLEGSDLVLGSELNGLIDDVRIYDRALSAFEVKALYELGEQPVQVSGSGTTTVVNGTVADGSIGPSKLSSEVSNALKPLVVGQPSSVVGVDEQSVVLDVDVDGANLSFQWKKDGVDITGETGRTLSIADLNASQHEGNYTVVVSNAFGSVTSSVARIDVNGSLTQGLVGWWKFDETEGTVASDSSGNGNDGNLTNGPKWTTGKFGGALSFDGDDDLVIASLPNINGSDVDFSQSAWIKTAETNPRGVIITKRIENNYGYPTLWITYGVTKLSLDLSGINPGILANQKSNDYRWHLICGIKEKSNYLLFVDGIFMSELLTAEEFINTNTIHFGNHIPWKNAGVDPGFKGLLDDIRIYDRALSAVEVKALYELGEQPVQESGAGTTTVVNGTVADGSITASKIADQTITTNQLSEQILKYLKPEITQQPTAGTIFAGSNPTFSVSAEGKYLTYQWKKNGVNLTGETNATLTITDANATQHDGNYSVVVSNDFGSVESGEAELEIYPWNVLVVQGVEMWLDSNDSSSIELNGDKIISWNDKSGNENNASQSSDSLRPSYGQDENGTFVRFTSSATDSNHATNVLADNYLLLNGITGKSIFFVIDHDGSPISYLLGSDYPTNRSYIFIDPAVGDYSISIDGQTSDSGSWWYYGSYVATGGNLGTINQTAINNSTLHSIIYEQNSPSTQFVRLGSSDDNKGGFGGKVREIISFSSYLSAADRQKVEGYLAHKWNLVTELPSDHPYKNSAP